MSDKRECHPHCSGPPRSDVSYIGHFHNAWLRLVRGWRQEQCESCQLWSIWVEPKTPLDAATIAYADEHYPLPKDWEEEPEYHGQTRFDGMEAFRAGAAWARANNQPENEQ